MKRHFAPSHALLTSRLAATTDEPSYAPYQGWPCAGHMEHSNGRGRRQAGATHASAPMTVAHQSVTYSRQGLALIAILAIAACSTVRVYPDRIDGVPTGHKASVSGYGTHVVQRGENLYRIASRYGITAQDLAIWNGLTTPFTLHEGQHLRVPPTTAHDKIPPSSAQIPSRTTAASPVPGADSPHDSTAVARSIAGSTSALGWQWPADGSFVEKRGSISGRPGLNIVGRAGMPVRAAGDGVVLYSGSGSPGHEELIVILHGGNWMSSYAHNRKRLVGEGQSVKAGAQIAEMGSTGVARDMLRFELLHHGEAVFPLLHLPKR